MAPEQNRPLPVPQPESDYYWEQAKNGKLVIQRCGDCDAVQFFPRVLCTNCSSRSLEWIESSGKGTVFTFAIVHLPPHPGFAGDVPYVTAIVELDEGVKMPSQVIGIEPEPGRIHIGMPVEVVFEDASDSIVLPKFKPVNG